jgi:chromosome segregation ATPase
MTETKELGKYEIIPSRGQLMAIAKYIEQNKDEKGHIDFSTRMLFESSIVSAQFGSISYLNGVITYLMNENWLDRIQMGHAGVPSSWNVNKFLNNLDEIVTREKAGRSRPKRESYEIKTAVQPEVEIVHKSPEKSVVETNATINNEAILKELKGAMNDIIGYLQSFPAEMSGHLHSIADRIEVTDENLITNLRTQMKSLQDENAGLKNKQEDIMKEVDGFMEEIDDLTNEKKNWEKEKMDLTAEVQRLNVQLEEVGRTVNYSKHSIYRQRNLIMDEVDRMVSAPAWTIKQKGIAYRTSIESKLNEIMSEIGIDSEE